MKGKFFFSILIPNFNGLHLLRECLDKIWIQDFTDYEIIIVDNGSTDGSVDFLLKEVRKRKNLKAILLNKNKGYCGGNNAGLKHVEGKYVILLNNDALLEKDFLKKAKDIISRYEGSKYVAFAPKILKWDSPEIIDKAGHLMYPDGLNRGRGHLQKDGKQFNAIEEILWPDGATAIFKADAILSVGGFDEIFFAYGDDADLGMRLRLLGYKSLYVPSLISYHKHSFTSGKLSPEKVKLVERNRIFLMVKNFPLKDILISPYYTLIRYLFNFYGLIKNKGSAGEFKRENGNLKLIFILIKAYLSFIKYLPEILKERKKIQKSKKISNREISKLIKKYRIDVRELTLN